MSDFYKANKTRGLFDASSSEAFKLSRSGVDLFVSCERCFYLDKVLGVRRPPGFPFNLNSAVDHLLKKEFDVHRAGATAHPLMSAYGLDAVPFQHADIDIWRENFKGVQFLHPGTNLLLTGAVDDVWVDPKGELMVVDYKSTSKDKEVTLDEDWQDGYRRQMEFYQWLLRQNGFRVSDTGYFVYCNGKRDKEAFDGRLEFDIKLLPYTGKDDWIEPTLVKIKECLMSDEIPASGGECDFCNYREAVSAVTQ